MSHYLILLSGFLFASAAFASGTPTPSSETDLPRSLTRSLNDTPMPTTLLVDETGTLVKDAAGLFGGAKKDAVTAIGNLLSIFDDSDFQKLVKDCGYSMFKGSRYDRKVYLKGFLSANAPTPNAFMDRLLAATVGHFDKVIDNIKGRADSSFSSFKCEVDILGYPLFELDYYVDQGDAAMMVATIKALEANFYFLAAHDLNSESLPELVEQIGSLLDDDAFGGGIEGLGVVDFIRNSDRFLRPLRASRSGDSPAACLQKAQTLFGEALDYLMKGDRLVRARTDGKVHIIGNKSDDLDHAVSYHSDGSTVALMRDHGSVVKTALTGTATIDLAWVEDLVALPKSLSRSEIQISLAPLFKTSPDISTKMPRFTSGSLDEASVIPPTLGGLLPDLTEPELLAILAESVAPTLTGEWKFPKGNELKASVGRDLTKYFKQGETNNISSIAGILPNDGAMRANIRSSFKCYHGLTPNSAYTFVIDLKLPSDGSGRSYNSYHGYLWADEKDDAVATLRWDATDNIRLWYQPGKSIEHVAKEDEWHRYVLTTDGLVKKLYVDGVMKKETSDHLALLPHDYCYLLGDDDSEDNTLDVSYAAFYSGVMSEQEVRLNHSRPLPHDAANRVLPTVAPSGVWAPTGAESAGAQADCAFGVPLVKGGGGYVATRAAAPDSLGFTAVIDCQLAKTRANGSVLVANGSDEAAGIYGTGSADSGAIDALDDPADFAGNAASATPLFGGRSRTTVSASGLHRLAIVRSAGSSDAALAYYVDGRRVEAENPFAIGSGLKPSAAMTYLAGDWAKVARVATYDTALSADEVDALGDASTVWPEPSAAAPAVSVTAAADRIGLGRDAVELTVAYSFAANEAGNVSVDFGDGTGDVALNRSGSGSVTFTHGYGAIGKKKIVVRAVDRTGAVAEGALTVSCVDVSYVAYARWLGGGDYEFLDATGRKVAGGAREARTALAIPDKATLEHFMPKSAAKLLAANPSGYTTLSFYNYELDEDTDWSDLDLSDFGADSRVDLKGHKLTLGAKAAPSGELTITDTTGGGELHIVLGEGETLENANMSFTGSLKLVKEGTGTFVQRADEQDYTGGTRLAGGTLAVKAGDLRGWGLELAGGTLEMRDGCTIGDLVLTDDSALKVMSINSGDANDPLVAGGSSWDFGGHTLDLVFSGSDPDLWIEHRTSGQGMTTSVTFHNGTLRTSCTTAGKGWLQDCGVDASDNVCYDFSHALRLRGDGKVRDFINRTPSNPDKISRFATTLSVFGRFAPFSSCCVGVKMMGESTLDLSDANITLPWNLVMKDKDGDRPLRFASGAIVFVDLTGRGVQIGDKVVAWTAKPDASVTFCAVSKDKTETVPYALEPGADGLYAVGKMTGEWKFPKGDELKASLGADLEKCTDSGKTADFAAVKGLLDADGAMRAGQYNAFKCQHGLTPGEPYTFVIDLKLPRGFTRTKKWQGYLWNGKGDQDAIAFLYLYNTSENDIRLWYESDGYTKSKVAEPDEWHRYVLSTDCRSKKVLYVDGEWKAESTSGDKNGLAELVYDYCYLLDDNNGENETLDVTYAAFYRGTMTAEEVRRDHSYAMPHDAGGTSMLEEALTSVDHATWTGSADDDVVNPANWNCWNVYNETLSVAPTGKVAVTLSKDTNWSGCDLSMFASGSTVDLRGHNLTVNATAASARLTVTDTTDPAESRGKFTLFVAESETATVGNLSCAERVTFVKDGAGTLVCAKAAFWKGPLELAGGGLTLTKGGTLHDLTLTADAELRIKNAEGSDDPKLAGGSTWNFGGHTLNLVFEGNDPDFNVGQDADPGSITFHNGMLRTSCTTTGNGWFHDYGVDASDNVCYDFGHVLRQRGDGKVMDFINRTPDNPDKITRFATTLSVFGRFVPLSSACVGVKMMGDSTLDLSDANITLPWNSVMRDMGGDRPLQFASGAIVFVDLTGRGVKVGDKVVAWTAKPDASVTFCAVSKDKTETVPYALESRDDGLYAVGKMTGEWKFPKGDELKASFGADLEEYTKSGKAADFAAVNGLCDADGAMRAGQYNAFKCQHGLTPGEPYTFVIDLKLPSGIVREKNHVAYLSASSSADAIACVKLEGGKENDIRLWYESGNTTTQKVAVADEWHRYVLSTDCRSKKVLYVDGEWKAESTGSLAKLTQEICYLLGDDDGEDSELDVTYAAFYRGTMTDGEVAANHSRPVPHDANGVNLLTVAAHATWTGATGDGDLGNSANWSCQNVFDEPVSEVLPYEETVIHVSATSMFDLSYPPNLPFDFKSFELEDPLVLQADFDWEGFDLSRISGNPTIDLNGHVLSLGMSVNTAAPFTVTDTTSAGGELHLVAPKMHGNEIEVANTNISFTGSFTLVKRGDGVLVPGKTGQSNAGGLRIEKGTVRTERSVAVGLLGAAGAPVTVSSNTTLSVTAGGNLGCCALTLAGGTLEVTKGCTMSNLWLTADSVFSEYADGNNDVHVSKHARWDLGGHTLDIALSGNDPDMYLGDDKNPPSYITIHNGTIRTAGHGWFQDCGVDAHDNVCYDFSSVLRLRGNSSVSNFVNRTTSTSLGVEGCTMSLYGTFTPLSQYCYSVTMQNGSAIDLRETGALPWNSVMIGEDPNDKTKKVDCPLLFAAGATVRVDLRGRTIEKSQKVISWATPPAGVRFKAIYVPSLPGLALEVRDDGLYAVPKMFSVLIL